MEKSGSLHAVEFDCILLQAKPLAIVTMTAVLFIHQFSGQSLIKVCLYEPLESFSIDFGNNYMLFLKYRCEQLHEIMYYIIGHKSPI